jgi:4-amino-4-deoxy-L-arabinose transferase-like glycosyltransferase
LVARFFLVTRLDNRVIYSDEQKNLALAGNLIAGAGYALHDGRPTAIIPAGYPFWLAALRVTGLTEPWHIRLAQVALSLLTIWLVYLFAQMLFGRPAALLAAAGCAFYPYFIFLPGTILATTLYSLLLVLGTWLYVRAVTYNNNKMLFFGGIVWGWAVLTVSTAVVLAGATLVWHLGHARASWRTGLRQAALFLTGLLLVVLPWLMRNQLVLGHAVLATNGGYNFWLGNNPESDLDEPCSLQTPREMDERIIRSGSELYADSLFSATARAWIAAEPSAFFRQTLLKALYFWRLDPSPVTASYIHNSGLARTTAILSFAPLLVLAFWGLIKAPPPLKKKVMLFFYFALAYTAVHAVMIVKVRFRLPIDHFIIMAAAYGLTTLWPHARASQNERTLGSE